MMSSIKRNNETLSVCYNGDTHDMSVTCRLEHEDILTLDASDFNWYKSYLMAMLEKLGLAESKLTFTAPSSGVYSIQASTQFGITAYKIS